MVGESGIVVETYSDSDVTVGSGALGDFPPSEGTEPSDVVDSVSLSVVEVLMVSVGQALAVVVISGWTEESVDVVPSEVKEVGMI